MDASLWHALENMAGWGQRYCAAISWSGRVSGVLTQSFFMKWLWKNRQELSQCLKEPIWKMRPYRRVISVNEEAQAIDGFAVIANRGLGVSLFVHPSACLSRTQQAECLSILTATL